MRLMRVIADPTLHPRRQVAVEVALRALRVAAVAVLILWILPAVAEARRLTTSRSAAWGPCWNDRRRPFAMDDRRPGHRTWAVRRPSGTLVAGAAGVPPSRATMAPMRPATTRPVATFALAAAVVAPVAAACGSPGLDAHGRRGRDHRSASPAVPSAGAPSLTPVPGGASDAPEPVPTRIGTTQTDWGEILDDLPSTFPAYPNAEPAEVPDTVSAARLGARPTPTPSPRGTATRSPRAATRWSCPTPAEDGSQVLDAQADLPECRIQMTFRPEDGYDDHHPGRLRLRERHRLTTPRGERRMAAEAGRHPGRGPAGPGPGRAGRAPRARRPARLRLRRRLRRRICCRFRQHFA